MVRKIAAFWAAFTIAVLGIVATPPTTASGPRSVAASPSVTRTVAGVGSDYRAEGQEQSSEEQGAGDASPDDNGVEEVAPASDPVTIAAGIAAIAIAFGVLQVLKRRR